MPATNHRHPTSDDLTARQRQRHRTSQLQQLSKTPSNTTPCSSAAAPANLLPRRLRARSACTPTAPARRSSASPRRRARVFSRSTAKTVRPIHLPILLIPLTSPVDACRQRLGELMCPSPKEAGMSKYCDDRTSPLLPLFSFLLLTVANDRPKMPIPRLPQHAHLRRHEPGLAVLLQASVSLLSPLLRSRLAD